MKGKSYKCGRCGREVAVRSKGLCPACRAAEKKPAVRSRKNRPSYSGFYAKMLEVLQMGGMSATGRAIHEPSVCNVCHILPKRTYKSVAEDADNIIFLTSDEHTKFDRYLDCLDFESLEKEFGMVWKAAVFRVKCMVEEGKVKETGKILQTIKERYLI